MKYLTLLMLLGCVELRSKDSLIKEAIVEITAYCKKVAPAGPLYLAATNESIEFQCGEGWSRGKVLVSELPLYLITTK